MKERFTRMATARATSARSRPPALGRWLLRWALPTGVVAEAIAGDLEQEFRARPARLRYLRHVAGIVLRSTHDRLRGHSWFNGRGSSTAGGPARGDGGPVPGQLPPRVSRRGESVLQDLHFAARMLAKRPLLTAMAISTLALGMGINTAIFSVVNALLLRPIPAIDDPATIVEISRGTGDQYLDVAWGAFKMLREGNSTLEDVAGWDGITLAYRDIDDAGADDTPVVLSGREITGNYFSVLGVEPALGRFFAPQQWFWPDVASEVVITHHLWQERYGGSGDVLGRAVSINGAPATIIGVAPEGFAGHQIIVQRDVFVPVGMRGPGMVGADDLESVRGGNLVLLGRLAEGVSLEAARDELGVLGDRFFADNGIDEPYHLRVDAYGAVPGSDRATVRLFFALLLLISSMVMAVACVNVANMLLSRALERRRELAIRVSLGAGRGRVARQLLTESTLLFVAAGIAGAIVTTWTTDLLVRRFLPQMTSTRLYLDVSLDFRVVAFAVGTAAMTGIVFGLAPALAATREVAGEALRGGAARPPTSRLRGLLVGGQMALALVLLVAAGLTVRALGALQSIDLGFDPEGVAVVELDLELAGYDAARSAMFYDELLSEVRAIPGVMAAATARKLPIDSVSTMSGIYPAGVDVPPESGVIAHFNRVSAGYFRTVAMPLREGRAFSAADSAGAPRVAVINAAMAARVWGEGSAVGKRFSIGRGAEAVSYEVIGVAADAHYHSFVEETPNFLYLAATQSPDPIGHLLIRATAADAPIGSVRAVVARLDPDVPVVEVTTARAAVDGFSMGQRLAAWVAGVVGLVGLLLGSVGVYGVTASAVSQRTHEIGVRMALGARAGDVRRLIVRSGLRAPLAGMLVGLLAAAAAAQLIGSFLYGVSTLDPWTYATVLATLGIAALAATLLPAQRAATTDPVETLRSN